MADETLSPGQRHQRLIGLRFKAAQGALTAEERAEMAELTEWSRTFYGFTAPSPVPETTADAPASPTAPGAPLPGTESGGGDDVVDLEGQVAAGGEYASFSDWANAMNEQFGKGVPGYDPKTGETTYTSWGQMGKNLLSVLSPTSTLAKAAMGRNPFGMESRYALNDPERIDYTDLGIDAAPADQFGHDPSVDAGPSGALDAFGGAGPDVSDGSGPDGGDAADSAAAAAAAADADADMGFGDDTWRRGGLIPGDRDGILEPRTIEAHEEEYVLRPEAVEAIGVPALDRLNRMGRNPARARQSSGIAALEALNGMPRRRDRGLIHSRKLGRVIPMGEM